MKFTQLSLILALYFNQEVDGLRITARKDVTLSNQVKDMVEVLGKRHSIQDMKIAVLEAEKDLNEKSAAETPVPLPSEEAAAPIA